MTNKQLLTYSCKSNWLGLFKKVYRKVNYSIEDILDYYCLNYNSYECTEYILNNHEISWNKLYDWLHYPSNNNNKELVLLLIKHGCDIDKEIELCKKHEYKNQLEFCLEVKKELNG